MTAKAIKKSLLGNYRKGRCFFIMKGTATPITITSSFEMNIT